MIDTQKLSGNALNHSAVLLVDDDTTLCQLLDEFLRGEGFDVQSVHSGYDAIEFFKSGRSADVVVLDIMMPDISGLEVLQMLRRDNNVPIIMLTGRGDDVDRIAGLELGADDYLGKPCNPRELAARLRAVLRRTESSNRVNDAHTVELNGVVVDPSTLMVSVQGEPLDLTQAEFRVLQVLIKHLGQTLSKEMLTLEVLHRKLSAHDRSIDVHISRVRQKLAKYPQLKIAIKSVRGVGYQMIVEDD